MPPASADRSIVNASPPLGEMRRLVYSTDWSRTPLGPIDRWPRSLRTLVDMLLAQPVAMIVLWGPDLVQVYNDAYALIAGAKHPAALGMPTRQCWPEVWHINGPIYDRVLNHGETVLLEDTLFPLARNNGQVENTYLNVSYGPARDDNGQIAGIFITVVEHTRRVQAEAGRVRVERELAEAKAAAEAGLARWRAVVENMAEGVVLADAHGNMLEWNRAALAIHGYTSGDDVRANFNRLATSFQILDADGNAIPIERWPVPRLIRGEAFRNWEVRVRRKDVPLDLTISYSGTPIRDRDGNIILVLVTLHDMTEERQAQRALRESEAHFRDTFEQSPIGMTVTDFSNRYLHVNPAYCRLVGYSREELLDPSFDFRTLVHPDDQARMLELQRQVRAGQIPSFFLEKRYIRKDGSIVWVRVTGTARRDAAGRPTEFIRLVENIDERKRAEAERTALLDSERAARSEAEILADAAQMVTGELDLQSLVQKVTDATTHLTRAQFGAFFYNVIDAHGESYSLYTLSGVPRERFASFPMPRATDVFGPTFRGEAIVRLDDVTRDSRYGRNAPYHGMPQGHLPVRSYLAVPVVSRSGEVLGGLFFGHSDIGVFTERDERLVAGIAAQTAVAMDNARLFDAARKANEAKDALLDSERAARSEAERASRMKDEFLSTLSHELRTPLNAIVGWSQILRTPSIGPADIAEGVATIERNARAQAQIIEDLLDMSRIVSGKLRLDVQRVDLAEVVRAGIDTIRPAADAKGVRIHTVVDPLAGPVSGDPNRLHQVLWNLLTNAVKFTPKGGRVQVLLERVNSHVEVSVIDTGEGIRPEFLPHVFDRFRQADATTTRQHGGLGLGLAIVKQLVEMHGGSVRVKSAGPGFGSTFIVALPLTVVHPEPPPETERRHPRGGTPLDLAAIDACRQLKGVKVLAVDDEPDALALIRRLLQDCEADVRTASSAAEALPLVGSYRPDVLVSDIGMPGEDGYSLIRKVRALGPESGGNVPALALTAYARAEDRIKALRAGFQMHVVKPVEPAELITVVVSLAGRVGS